MDEAAIHRWLHKQLIGELGRMEELYVEHPKLEGAAFEHHVENRKAVDRFLASCGITPKENRS